MKKDKELKYLSNAEVPPGLDEVLRLPVVMKITKMSCSQIYYLMEKGRFPKQIKLGDKARGWRRSDIQAWIAAGTAECADSAPAAA